MLSSTLGVVVRYFSFFFSRFLNNIDVCAVPYYFASSRRCFVSQGASIACARHDASHFRANDGETEGDSL